MILNVSFQKKKKMICTLNYKRNCFFSNITFVQSASSAEKSVGQAPRRNSLVVSTAAASDIQLAITQLTSWVLSYRKKTVISNDIITNISKFLLQGMANWNTKQYQNNKDLGSNQSLSYIGVNQTNWNTWKKSRSRNNLTTYK